jgi:Flp pilus assembly protein TadD
MKNERNFMKLSANSDDSLGVLGFDAAGRRCMILPLALQQGDTYVDGRSFLAPIDRENENKAQFGAIKHDIEEDFSAGSLPGLTVERALEFAFSCYSQGRFVEAEQTCRLVLRKVRRQVDAMQLLGVLLERKGRYAEAAQFLREAVRQVPGRAGLHNSLGMALIQLKKPEEAVTEFEKAFKIRPDFAKAYNNLGVALMRLGRIDEAIIACRQAVRLQSDFKQAYNNHGLALKKAGKLEEAVASYEKAVGLDPQYAGALSNLGMALIAQGRLKEAAEKLQKAVNLAPNSAEFLNNLGVLFNRQGFFEKAVDASERAVAINPDSVQAHNNLGTALMELGRFSEAEAAFDKAIVIDPECAEAHHNRSLVLLLTARFEDGWDEYEWRWRNDGFSTPIRPFSQPWWGGSLEGVTKLLVWAEQGIGDEVQFSGLVRQVLSRGIRVVVECDRRLVTLLQRSFPGVDVVERTNPPALLLRNPSITHQIPMASLPRVLRLSPDCMPFQSPFLVPDENQRDLFRSEYKKDGNPLLVGISFRSGNSQEGPKRSVGLEHWGPILNVAGARFVSLQYGECSREIQAACDRFGIEVLKDEKVDPLVNLESLAAQVAAMDLVISVDNSTVHFAGALGVDVWTMLASEPDWRWGLKGDRTRWYPTMRLFRQQQRGNWEPVISKLAGALTSLLHADEN